MSSPKHFRVGAVSQKPPPLRALERCLALAEKNKNLEAACDLHERSTQLGGHAVRAQMHRAPLLLLDEPTGAARAFG